jgi:hypothetical protein
MVHYHSSPGPKDLAQSFVKLLDSVGQFAHVYMVSSSGIVKNQLCRCAAKALKRFFNRILQLHG